ncbi:ABC transporter permease [Sediminispirochaeta bajacaliforniensis]|uniref:ABC transporter permease n=1 Tax=Sediminispirochaeta bajacaliforniensis TaxID=148 RepID=UPI00035F80EF|nr:FtsX-like permease family protein [Sediminispirochaeta bajacaliforniensis]
MRYSISATVASMALRNLARHRVKTVITALAVAVSVALYIFMDGWLLGMNLDSRRNIVSYEMGAAKIQTKAYFSKKDELPMYESFTGWQGIASALERSGYDAAPRFVFSGTLYSRTGSAPILFNAMDPKREHRLLRYTDFVDAGRFPRSGSFEIALGTMAAEKLHVGIPRRPSENLWEDEVLAATRNEEERDFVQGLYTERFESGEAKMALRDDVTHEEINRLWDILYASGRMDVRISTVIDMIAAPEKIREERFEEDLLPSLTAEDRQLIQSAYTQDPLVGDYLLSTDDSDLLDRVLKAMTAADYSGAIRHVNQLIDAVVVGIINSPNPKTNGNIAYIPLDALQGTGGLMLDGAVTELLVRASNAKDSVLPGSFESPDTIKSALVSSLAEEGKRFPSELVVKGWEDYSADYFAASAGDHVSTRIMALFLFLLSFIGIANTMLMAVLERTKEIGMMRALGMTDGQLLFSYVLEAGLVGLIGASVGVLLGCLINIPMVHTGIDFSSLAKQAGGDFGYRITSQFRSAWNPKVIVGTAFIATLLSALMALPPTFRALRMPVTESLRFE